MTVMRLQARTLVPLILRKPKVL